MRRPPAGGRVRPGRWRDGAPQRMGARRPSGRPGIRRLRIDLKPLSTERPGPTRGRTSPTGWNVPPVPRGR
ncbi:hypothetical protein GCM10010451_16120 [Streptomyces virens]|uniref:Uncharacterized protein n=1 Tax=Streptomyces virens TaxID=285572 RepID=A0ABP6P5H5_9ACTN